MGENNIIRSKIVNLILPGNIPKFLIIGVQKCATTFLHDLLSYHPQLIPSKKKELFYFNLDKNYKKGERWYASHFKSFSWKNSLFYESTPGYIYSPKAIKRISKMDPKIKLILILRDPVSRAFSAWNMYRLFFDTGHIPQVLINNEPGIIEKFYKDRSSFASFEEWIDLELKIWSTNVSEPSLLRRGLYHKQISCLFSSFSEENILILGYTDLIENTRTSVATIERFLELEFGISYSNLPVMKMPKNKRSYKSEMKVQTRAFLEDFYKSPNAQLLKLLGRPINW